MNTQNPNLNVNLNPNPKTADAPTPDTPPVSSPRTAEALAMLERVETWRAEIPQFLLANLHRDHRTLLTARLVPAEMLERTAVALTTIESLSRGDSDADELRDLVQYALAFGPVADAIVRLGQEMQHSVDAARAKAGAEALVTYRLAQRLAAIPGHEDLIPVVAEMRRALETAPRFRSRRAKKDAAATPASPTPAPAPSASPSPVPAAPPTHPAN